MAFSLNPLDWFKPQTNTPAPVASQQPQQPSIGSSIPYVGPYSPEAYNAAAMMADGGAGAPYAPNVLEGGRQILSKFATPTSGAGGGTAAPAYDPNTDSNLVGQARGLIGNDQNTLNNLYGAINGALTGYAQDARGNVDKQYNNLQQQQDNTYRTNIAGSDAAFGARNAFDSSYRGNADQSMTNAYNQSNQSLGDQKNQAYAGIGSTVQGVQSQLANKPQYDLSQYKDVNALTSLHNELGKYISSLQGTQQQLTPQGALVQKLNSVAPLTSNLDSTLKGQLKSIVDANTPSEAQQPLAMAYMQRAGITDPKQQQAYLDYLKQITQTTPSSASLATA